MNELVNVNVHTRSFARIFGMEGKFVDTDATYLWESCW